jgi:hypothetical protein
MTRAEAKALGLKTYTSGKKCRKHPDSPRRVKNGNCHRCIADRVKRTRWAKERQQRAAHLAGGNAGQ